jgi:hypothetical protein
MLLMAVPQLLLRNSDGTLQAGHLGLQPAVGTPLTIQPHALQMF